MHIQMDCGRRRTDKKLIMKKKKKAKGKITIEDYIKAVKKADRDNELSQLAGWRRTTEIHKNKKVYDRKRDKKAYEGE